MKLAVNLLKLSRKRGWSLAQLAREAGVPSQTLHGWTTGRAAVNLAHLKKVARALEVSLHVLIFDEPDPFDKPSDEILEELFSGDVRVTLHRIDRKQKS